MEGKTCAAICSSMEVVAVHVYEADSFHQPPSHTHLNFRNSFVAMRHVDVFMMCQAIDKSDIEMSDCMG